MNTNLPIRFIISLLPCSLVILTLVGCITNTSANVQTPVGRTIADTDVHNFYALFHALEAASSTADTLQLIDTHYLDRASDGLRAYFDTERRENNKDIGQEYLTVLRQYPYYFRSIEPATLTSPAEVRQLNDYLGKAQRLYPDFTSRPTTVAIGFFNSAGKSMADGSLYIGAEMVSLRDSTALMEWKDDPWLQFLAPRAHLVPLILHEQVHFQRRTPLDGGSLLDLVINEGAAVFAVELIAGPQAITRGGGLSERALQFGQTNAEGLWTQFRTDLITNSPDRWLYNADDVDWPKDLGYVVGYQICRAYYERHSDKAIALKAIMELTDPTKIYAQSGLAE